MMERSQFGKSKRAETSAMNHPSSDTRGNTLPLVNGSPLPSLRPNVPSMCAYEGVDPLSSWKASVAAASHETDKMLSLPLTAPGAKDVDEGDEEKCAPSGGKRGDNKAGKTKTHRLRALSLTEEMQRMLRGGDDDAPSAAVPPHDRAIQPFLNRNKRREKKSLPPPAPNAETTLTTTTPLLKRRSVPFEAPAAPQRKRRRLAHPGVSILDTERAPSLPPMSSSAAMGARRERGGNDAACGAKFRLPPRYGSPWLAGLGAVAAARPPPLVAVEIETSAYR